MTIKLLSHFDGVNGSQVFVEETGNHPLTALGNAQLAMAINKFPTASVKVIPNTDAVTFQQAPDFDFGAGNFTFDFWVYPISFPVTWNALYHHNAHYGYYVRIHNNGSLQQLISNNNTSWANIDSSATGLVTLGNWHHIACVRNINDWRVYLNGVNVISRINSGVMAYSVSKSNGIGSEALINGSFPGIQGLNGYIDEFRITNEAEWTENFIPPTEPYSLEGVPIGVLNFTSQLGKIIKGKSQLAKTIIKESQITKEMKFLSQISKVNKQ